MAESQAIIDQWHAENDDATAPAVLPPEDEASELAPEAAAEPAPKPAPPALTLDDLLPDDPRIPESMRGKPIATLLQYNREKDVAAQRAGYERNAERERAEAYKVALEKLAERVRGDVPRETPPAAVRASEAMRRRGIDPRSVFTDADSAFDAAADVASEAAAGRILPEVQAEIQKQSARVSELERAAMTQSLRAAFLEARPANVPLEQWEDDRELIATWVVGHEKNILDPASYREAGEWLEQQAARRSGRTSAAPPPSASAPAPPVGNGSSPPPERKTKARVSPHMLGAFNEVTRVLRDQIGVNKTTDDILDSMRDDPKYGRMFE